MTTFGQYGSANTSGTGFSFGTNKDKNEEPKSNAGLFGVAPTTTASTSSNAFGFGQPTSNNSSNLMGDRNEEPKSNAGLFGVEDSFITMTKEIITLNMEKTNTMTKKNDGRRIKIDQNNKSEKIEMGDK